MKFDYEMHMKKNIVLIQMKKVSENEFFRKKQIKLILEPHFCEYFGCAIRIDLPIKKMSKNFEVRMYGTKDLKLFDRETVRKVQSTLDMIQERHLENNTEENRYLLNIKHQNIKIPIKLDKFISQEKVFHLEKKTRLLVYWREYLHTEI